MLNANWGSPGALHEFSARIGSGTPVFARGRSFARGEIGMLFQGSASDPAVDVTKMRGQDSLSQNIFLPATGGVDLHKYGMVGVVNEADGITEDSYQGALFTGPGDVEALVHFRNNGTASATEAAIIGQPVFLTTASSREMYLTLNAGDTGVGRCVGFMREAKAEGAYGTTAAAHLVKIFFSGLGAFGAAS